MTDLSQPGVSHSGLVAALRRVRDPLLFLGLPFAFVAMSVSTALSGAQDVGFDFIGTLWEPARALLDGIAIYPEPTRAAIEIGNPAVYPPPFIVAAVPLAFLPAQAAAWVWSFALLAGVLGALRIVGVLDWRCYVLAGTSPVVLHGLYWGNLTLLLMVPVALAWRYRDRATVVGLARGRGHRREALPVALARLAAADAAVQGGRDRSGVLCRPRGRGVGGRRLSGADAIPGAPAGRPGCLRNPELLARHRRRRTGSVHARCRRRLYSRRVGAARLVCAGS